MTPAARQSLNPKPFQGLLKACRALDASDAPADGLQAHGSSIQYKANVRRIVTEGEGNSLKAVGVQLADGRIYRGKVHCCSHPKLQCPLSPGLPDIAT